MGFLDSLRNLTRSYEGEEESEEPEETVPSRPPERKPAPPPAPSRMQMALVKPERFDAAAEIVGHLRNRNPVVVNMERTPEDVARRVVDFFSGAVFMIDGDIKKVSESIYLLTPPGVDLVGTQSADGNFQLPLE